MKSPRIDNRRDILLLLLYSPGKDGAINESITGRTRLVKMLFLFREELLPHFKKGTAITEENFYEFFPWSYGPFSSQVYDDLNFFILRGFIEVEEAEDEPIPQSLEEWEHWLAGSAGNQLVDDTVVEYTEQSFRLSATGKDWTSVLYNSLNSSQKDSLRMFKKRMALTPLRAILRYVYEEYPSQIENSEIREEILGSGD